jgi:lipase maturation factor 1
VLRQLDAGVGGLEAASAWILGSPEGTSYVLARWIFLRALGLIYLIAFVSFWVQAEGLIGSGGIAPMASYLDGIRSFVGASRYRMVPTVFWLGASDEALKWVCGLGALGAVLVIADVATGAVLIGLWVLYLSLVSVGQDFLAFQWDALLLEAGFLAIWATSFSLKPQLTAPASATMLLLLWWLLFRLTFQSGLVKLTWGDPTWRDLSALNFHFYTQPLPTSTAWYAQQLPAWCKRSAAACTLVLEIVVPIFFFGPRSLRLLACAATIFLQCMIYATGNYTFFNLLTIALALLLVDDRAWAVILPARVATALAAVPKPAPGGVAGVARAVVALVVFALSCGKFWLNLAPGVSLPAPVLRVMTWVDPFRSVNSYGLFRVMTTARSEIVIEGSDDRVTWRPYEFRYKPGDPLRRPEFVEPYQPRLDWQMWFAALSGPDATSWFGNLLGRLLQGAPAVLGLLKTNPFPDHPPRFIRAQLYDYRFTTARERHESGAWWARTLIGAYVPPLSLEELVPGGR